VEVNFVTTFLVGLVILFAGGAFYGRVCERVMKPDDRRTPALSKSDGVDYVPMRTWRNSLINLLNIAGTGPILGPIQGILFGPVAFILIPIGNVLAGSMHDYFAGMLAMRNNGMQMPDLVKKYTNRAMYDLYNVFVCVLLLLAGAVFMFTPGDIVTTQALGFRGGVDDPAAWAAYGVIFIYYILATLFPIDKLIGRLYPVFGTILLSSAAGVLCGIFMNGYELPELTLRSLIAPHPFGQRLIPMFFITVACGIVSGFHATQATIISRSVTSERQGRVTFYNMMVLEGFIAMIWAAAAIGAQSKGIVSVEQLFKASPRVIGIIARDMLGEVGGMIVILGVIVLPITSGDTALRALRLMLADYLNIDQKSVVNRLKVSLPVFSLVGGLIIWAMMDQRGFNALWRYFAWTNQTIASFTFAIATIYLIGKGRKRAAMMSMIPGAWYAFITFTFICSDKIGLNLPLSASYGLGAAFAVMYVVLVYLRGLRMFERKMPLEAITAR
jgi:carbon starvation protein CstA